MYYVHYVLCTLCTMYYVLCKQNKFTPKCICIWGEQAKTNKKVKPLPKMDFLKKKAVWGVGDYPLKKVKPLPKMDFLKKKSVWGEGA